MPDLLAPIPAIQRLRIQETGSDTRLRPSDGQSQRDRQGKKRNKGGRDDDANPSQGEDRHSVDLLA